MLDDSQQRTAALDSIAFMYMSGTRWSAGDIVGTTLVDQRIFLARGEDAREYEFRQIDGDSWWRIRRADGWREGSFPVNVERVVETEKLRDGTEKFMGGVIQAGLRDPEWVETPLETSIQTHRVSGRVNLAAIPRMGLGILGDHGDEVDVTFHAWIEQETGYIARLVFEGVPPALPPLGMLYLFDHNVMKPSENAKPHPDSMAPLVADSFVRANGSGGREGRVYAPVIVSDPTIKLAPIAPLHGVDLAEVETVQSGPAQAASTSAVGPLKCAAPETPGSSEQAVEVMPPVVERQDGSSPERTRYVLPVDGYAIEFPDDWEVDALPDAAGSLLVGRDPTGTLRWEVRRFDGTRTIFDLLQQRIDALESSEWGRVEHVDAELDTASRIPEACLRHETPDGRTPRRDSW